MEMAFMVWYSRASTIRIFKLVYVYGHFLLFGLEKGWDHTIAMYLSNLINDQQENILEEPCEFAHSP